MIPVEDTAGRAAFVLHDQPERTPDEHADQIAYVKCDRDHKHRNFIDDAREIGLTDVVEVMENGLRDIAGTQMDMLPEAVRMRIEGAGLVIAKGQGNFETLMDCGLNVYFLFLSKCASYTQWFGFERFSGILKNAKRMDI